MWRNVAVVIAVIFFAGCGKEEKKENVKNRDDALVSKRFENLEGKITTIYDTFAAFRRGYVPDEVMFCGEEVPLYKWWVRQKLIEALRFYGWFSSGRERMMMYATLKSQYFPSVERALRMKGYPDDLKYIPMVESEFTLDAISSVGAVGAWQFMSYAAREVDLQMSETFDERLFFERATEGALTKLGSEYDSCFENWCLTVAAYNAGYPRVQNAVARQGDTLFFNLILPKETITYLYRMIAVKIIFEHPEEYSFEFEFVNDSITLFPYVTDAPKSMIDLAQELGVPPLECKLLNPQFVADIVPRGSFTIRVPSRLYRGGEDN